jgi:uncharacterized protein YacL
MVIHIVRAAYLLVVMAFTISYAYQHDVYSKGANYTTGFILAPLLVAAALVVGDMLWKRKRLGALSGMFFGLLAGLVIAYLLTQIVTLVRGAFEDPSARAGLVGEGGSEPRVVVNVELKLPADAASRPADASRPEVRQWAELSAPGGRNEDSVSRLINLLLGASAVYMCVSFVLQTKDDFRFVIPYVEFARQTKGARAMLLDTSAIIDGRIADVAETRMLDAQLVVPRFVLAELQTVADSDDRLRRNRGRRGLDVLNKLRAGGKIDIQILDARVPAVDEAPDVDAKLVALARHLDARIVTTDYNLNKIAQLRRVDVINVNDLAGALRPVVLPGETLSVRVVKPGEEAGQGVGYLEDGTMVVVEGGRDNVGKDVALVVTSVLQTSAGRMIFGRAEGAPNGRR